ncbi:MAG: ATP-binding protein [Melioribacteraceae bacterium]|nr:ATP-binding protein [Melioribacteraceae bacterium]
MDDLIQNNKLTIIGKLTASLLHEVRNPLSAIKLNLDYMKMSENELSSEIVESINSSLEAFDRINHIIVDVLDFTRKTNSSLKGTSLNRVTERALEIIHSTAVKRGITIEKYMDEELPNININENKLLQVLLNLINNAIDASSNKSKIIIRTCMVENSGIKKIIWEVEDFGCGIKPDDVQKIKKGYFTSKSEGSGVGLMVCKSLLDEMKAEFLFDSYYGKGTKFYIKFTV